MSSKAARTWWPYLLIAAMVFAFFWDSFLAGKALVMRDTFTIFLPWHVFGRQAFLHGTLPLWNPYSNCGQPFIGESQTAFFYPPNLLFYVLPVVFALKLWLALHVFIAAAATHALARHWRLTISSSLIAAISFAFGTYMIASLEFHGVVGTVVWTPLVLLLMSRLLDCGREIAAGLRAALVRLIPPTLWLGLVLATQFLNGHQQVFLYSGLIYGIYFAVICAKRFEPKPLLASCAALVVAVVLSLGLSMTQLLETLTMVPLSVRGAGFDPRLDMGSLHPRLLMSWVMPFFAGKPSHFSQWWGFPDLTMFEFWVGTAYVGLPPLVLATLSLTWLARPNARRDLKPVLWGLLLVTGIGLVLSMGQYTPVYMWCYAHLPAINKFRWPSKFLQLVAFSLPLLGAIGLQGLLERGEKTERRVRAALVAAWALVWLAMAAAWLAVGRSPGLRYHWLTGGAFVYNPRFPQMLATVSADLGKAVVFLGLTLFAVAVLMLRRAPLRWKHAAVVGLPLVTFVNLFAIGRQVQPTITDGVYRSVLESKHLQNSPDPGRFITDQYDNPYDLYGVREPEFYKFVKDSGGGEVWLPLHVFKAYGVGVIQLADYTKFKDQLWTLGDANPGFERLTNVMNVRDMILVPLLSDVLTGKQPPRIQFSKNKNALPRALVMQSWTVRRGDQETSSALLDPKFDLYRSVIVDRVPGGWPNEQKLAPDSTHEPITELAKAGVDEIKYGWNRVDLKVRTTGRAFLFLSDTYYPGWRATVDGKDVPISRANMIFRAIPLETPGPHAVSFVYWPKRVWAGLFTTTATVLFMAALGLLARLIRKGRSGL